MGWFFNRNNKKKDSEPTKRIGRSLEGEVIFEVQVPRKYCKDEYYEDYAILNVSKVFPKIDKIFQDFISRYPDYSLVLNSYDAIVDTLFIKYEIFTDYENKGSEDLKKVFIDFMEFKDKWNEKDRIKGEDVFILRGMELYLIILHVNGRFSELNRKESPYLLMKRLGAKQ